MNASRGLALVFCIAGRIGAQPHSLESLLDGAAFASIPAGEFSMGSKAGNADEQPIRKVRVPAAIEMGKFEVTQAQWDALMRDPHAAKYENPSHFKGPELCRYRVERQACRWR